jgi:predicted dehydrogenase
VADHGQAYWFDNANGATPLTSATLHALDSLHFVLGEFDAVAAGPVNITRSPSVNVNGVVGRPVLGISAAHTHL